MSQISSGVGLVSGFPIASTVAKLIALDSEPVQNLTNQNTALSSETTAITALEAQLTAIQSATQALGASSTYTANTVNSSNSSALSASTTAGATPGTYQFTPLQLAQSQQLQSSAFASDTAALGAGTFSFQYGGFVNQGVSLSALNGGAGVPQGEIQITDHSGATATINLSSAQTIDDVVNDINNNGTVRVTAQIVGNHLQLTDNTGLSTGTLQVQDVDGGTTAEALGLGGIDTTASTASGQDITTVSGNTPLSELNDGLGVRTNNVLPDLNITLHDGTTASIDLDQLPVLGTTVQGTTNDTNVNAQLTFSALQAGSAYAGTTVSFVDNPAITAGNETVTYDASSKSIIVDISSSSTANDVINALSKNTTVSALFSAKTVSGGDGTGIVSASDVALITGPDSSASTPGTLSSNARLTFTAKQSGSQYDNTQIQFVDNPSITAGNETVAYDSTNNTLTFQIAAGQTTANDVISALDKNPTASAVFGATLSSGSNGTGLISTSDGVVTTGGAIVEPEPAGAVSTLNGVINAINNAAPGKIQAAINAAGTGLTITDLTSGSGTFSITDAANSHAADDLGLNVAADGNTINGNPLTGGLDSVLLRNLSGGAGLGTLGVLDLQDRSGKSTSVDLSSAQTLDDVIQDINTATAGAGVGITASVNQARNGIILTDTTGSTSGNLVVGDGDSTDTAEALGIATNSATSSVNSGSLHLQFVNQNTLLSSLNGGQGVPQGTLQITGTNGQKGTLNVNSSIKTVGQVITAINALGIGVTAQIDTNGDGISLVDTAHGSGTLSVTEGNNTTAASLHLLGAATTQTIGGKATQVITGSNVFTVAISSTDTLQSLITKINGLNAGVTASEFNNGSSTAPYQFTLFNQGSGTASEIAVDTSQTNFTVHETAQAQDALLQFGAPGGGGSVAASPTNSFNSLVPNLNITASSTSTTPVTLTVSSDSSTFVSAVQQFVTAYNTVESSVSTDTTYNTTTNTAAVLQGDGNVLQVQDDISNLITGQFGSGSYNTLASLGITVNQDGSLSLDATTLQNAYSADPTDIQNLFTAPGTGLAAQFNTAINNLAGATNSVLGNELTSYSTQTANNTARINELNAQLQLESQRLTSEFDQSELTISALQQNQSALNSIQPFYDLNTSSNSLNSSTTSSSSTSVSGVGNNLSSGLS
jgi:flagellar hook-associated protein 2